MAEFILENTDGMIQDLVMRGGKESEEEVVLLETVGDNGDEGTGEAAEITGDRLAWRERVAREVDTEGRRRDSLMSTGRSVGWQLVLVRMLTDPKMVSRQQKTTVRIGIGPVGTRRAVCYSQKHVCIKKKGKTCHRQYFKKSESSHIFKCREHTNCS